MSDLVATGRKALKDLTIMARAGRSVGAAIDASVRQGSSWYWAAFAAAQGSQTLRERAVARYGLRDAIAQPGVTTLDRVRTCGRPIGNSYVALMREPEAGVYANGVETCSSPWSCPVCAAKIRNRRAEEITRATENHVKAGGGVLLITFTLPHGTGDTLRNSFGTLKEAMRRMTQNRDGRADRIRYGILGNISAYEVTHGVNGWHPHCHQLAFTNESLSVPEAVELQKRWQKRWDHALQALGWQKSLAGRGVRVDVVRRGAKAAAAYIAKLQEGERWTVNAANELARGDLKAGRKSSRTPFEIVADFLTDGSADDLDLWQEFEQATRGKSSIRWSRGLRDLLLPEEEEVSDEEAANADVGGEAVAVLTPWLYREVRRRPYGLAMMFAATEAGGFNGTYRWLKALGYDTAGLMVPDPSMSLNNSRRE